MNYKILSNIMSKFFNNKTFHSTTDEIKMKKISKKEKIKFPCEKQEHIYINKNNMAPRIHTNFNLIILNFFK